MSHRRFVDQLRDGDALDEVYLVTDKQVRELGVQITPLHPESALRQAGVLFESKSHPARDFFANHYVADGDLNQPETPPFPPDHGASPRGIDRGSMITEPSADQLLHWLVKHGFVASADTSAAG